MTRVADVSQPYRRDASRRSNVVYQCAKINEFCELPMEAMRPPPTRILIFIRKLVKDSPKTVLKQHLQE